MNPVRFLALVYHYAYYWMVEEQSYKLKDGKPIPKWPFEGTEPKKHFESGKY
jgi:hypothetical protein